MSNTLILSEAVQDPESAKQMKKRKAMNALAGFAVDIHPVELSAYTRGSLSSLDVAYRANERVIDLYNRSASTPILDSDDAYYLLKNGICDVSKIVEGTLRRIPHKLSFEQALSVVKHPDTAEEIAVLATRPAKGVDGLDALIADAGTSYFISPEHSSIATGVSVFPKRNGCPAAGNPATGELHPTPLFRKFVAWSGELSLRALQYADQDL